MRQSIQNHEGRKYLRTIHPAKKGEGPISIEVDVYGVLKAFNVTCPALAHCIKKLLACGERGKGNRMADLKGAMAALNRAIDLEEDDNPPPPLHNQVMSNGFLIQFDRNSPLPTPGSEFPYDMMGNTVKLRSIKLDEDRHQVLVDFVR